MSGIIDIQVESSASVQKKINRIKRAVLTGIVRGLRSESDSLHEHITKTHLKGATEDGRANFARQKLRRRTGEFARKFVVLKVETLSNGVYRAGVRFDAPYAGVHVGEKGKVTTIKPVNKKWLTIPLPPALTRAGVLRQPAKDMKDLFFLWADKSKAPVLAKKMGNGKIKAYFVLAKMVKIRTRIYPKEILRARRNQITAGIKRAIMDAVRSHASTV